MTMPATALTDSERIDALTAENAKLRSEARVFGLLLDFIEARGRLPRPAEILGLRAVTGTPAPAIPGVGVTPLRLVSGGAR